MTSWLGKIGNAVANLKEEIGSTIDGVLGNCAPRPSADFYPRAGSVLRQLVEKEEAAQEGGSKTIQLSQFSSNAEGGAAGDGSEAKKQDEGEGTSNVGGGVDGSKEEESAPTAATDDNQNSLEGAPTTATDDAEVPRV